MCVQCINVFNLIEEDGVQLIIIDDGPGGLQHFDNNKMQLLAVSPFGLQDLQGSVVLFLELFEHLEVLLAIIVAFPVLLYEDDFFSNIVFPYCFDTCICPAPRLHINNTTDYYCILI